MTYNKKFTWTRMVFCYGNNMHTVLKMPSCNASSLLYSLVKIKKRLKNNSRIRELFSMMMMSAGHLHWIAVIDLWNFNSVETIQRLLNWNLIYLFLSCSGFIKKAYKIYLEACVKSLHSWGNIKPACLLYATPDR